MPNDPPITPALVKQHKLNDDEYARVLAALGRAPTYAELGVFSVMWSEHCSYKSSRVHLRRLPTKGPRVIQGPGENAGVVDIGDGFAAVFKMESHNHPSFIEPYQGAATGVGGILRDVFTMGARPIASLNSLRFGRPDHPRTPELLRGVVAGIGGYGNCIGVPTVGGEVQFDERYDGNILVNAFTCGVARTDRIFYGRASGIGNSILYIGAKTGRDGIHGATMASDEFARPGGPVAAPDDAGGRPVHGQAPPRGVPRALRGGRARGHPGHGRRGAHVVERRDGGARRERHRASTSTRVPRRAKAMTPYEILLSESQERMLLVAKPGKRGARPRDLREVGARRRRHRQGDRHEALGRQGDARATTRSTTAPSKRAPVVVCDIPIGVLTDDAPVYDRPRARKATRAAAALETATHPRRRRPRRASSSISSASPNVGSRAWVWRQYDQIVRGGTVVRPGLGRRRSCACRARRDGKHDRQVPRLRRRLQRRACASSTRSSAPRWRSPRCAATSCARAPSPSASPTA